MNIVLICLQEFIEIEDDEEEEYDENAASTELNNHDNEESINLTIGEDEQNFLNEEEVMTIKL